jgi:hypothetical protein
MDPKLRPNHEVYLKILRRMTPEQKLQKVFELTEMTRQLFLDGLRITLPHLSETELRKLYLERLLRCHNRNY